MSDTELLAQCQVKGFQGSGPGGQHRNKTNTGVALQLPVFNLEIRCCEDRSAHVNRLHALHRLRIRLALQVRAAPSAPMKFPGSVGHIQSSNPSFPLFLAQVFDLLEFAQGEMRSAAEPFGLSPSALIRILAQDKSIWEALLVLRHRHGKAPLKA